VLNADRDARGPSSGTARWIGMGVVAAVLIAGLTGCAGSPDVFSHTRKTQILFYVPPGAAVALKGADGNMRQVAEPGPFSERLETAPEENAIFNLGPGRYEFKYTSAEGLPGVSVYGELNVYYANSHEARVFQRRAFIPMSLPSEFYKRVEAIGDEIYPFRSESYRTSIDELDVQRLRQGDVVEKVIFVADLKKAEKMLDEVEQDLVVCEREMEYADARFRLAYENFRTNVGDIRAVLLRTDRQFIKWEKRRKELDQEMEQLLGLQKRLKSLLKGDRVLARRGMLVLATEGVIEPHRDAVKAASELGEVLVVMRLGGRHLRWGIPNREMVAKQP